MYFRSEYLISLFHKHDTDRDGILSPSELANLFSVSTEYFLSYYLVLGPQKTEQL